MQSPKCECKSAANKLCNRYLDALNHNDLETKLQLFEEDARVVSPLYGKMDAKQFYKSLFEDTHRSKTHLIQVYESTSGTIALHFNYDWTLENESTFSFDCIDVFQMNSEKSKFKNLRIIYDTAPLREEFQSIHAVNQSVNS